MKKDFYGTLKGILRMIRPFNCLGSAAIIPAAFLVSSSVQALITSINTVATVSLAAFLMCAAGNSLNDYYDLRVDRINRPSRPLASGAVKKSHAILVGIIFNLVGLYLFYTVSVIVFAISLSILALMTVYNKYSKRLGLVGNVIVSFMIFEAAIIGGIVAGGVYGAVYFAASAFFINLSRELVKAVEDMKGDKTVAKASFPLRYGIKKTSALASVSALAGAAFMVYLQKFYSPLYLVLIMPAVYGVSKAVIPAGKLDAKRAGIISKNIKTSGTIGILAALVAGIFR
ncbi:MAG: geranylgeranylglycerol-phosphate geranylgeranyltransferase [Candidatus Aenigmarchaeota archaeon]|nr:geranylgeranylglycerol-phosphate geranylgeranyltransferase [Candidatus Aenigmarchaeota archaeon]